MAKKPIIDDLLDMMEKDLIQLCVMRIANPIDSANMKKAIKKYFKSIREE